MKFLVYKKEKTLLALASKKHHVPLRELTPLRAAESQNIQSSYKKQANLSPPKTDAPTALTLRFINVLRRMKELSISPQLDEDSLKPVETMSHKFHRPASLTTQNKKAAEEGQINAISKSNIDRPHTINIPGSRRRRRSRLSKKTWKTSHAPYYDKASAANEAEIKHESNARVEHDFKIQKRLKHKIPPLKIEYSTKTISNVLYTSLISQPIDKDQPRTHIATSRRRKPIEDNNPNSTQIDALVDKQVCVNISNAKATTRERSTTEKSSIQEEPSKNTSKELTFQTHHPILISLDMKKCMITSGDFETLTLTQLSQRQVEKNEKK